MLLHRESEDDYDKLKVLFSCRLEGQQIITGNGTLEREGVIGQTIRVKKKKKKAKVRGL